MQGILDFIKSPAGQGLISAVAGGMANARQGTPWNNVGRGLVSGIQGYSGAMDQESRAGQAAQAQEMQALQRQQIEQNLAAQQQTIEQQRAQAAWRAGLPEIISKATNPTFGAGDEGPTMSPASPDVLNSYLMSQDSPFLDDILKQKIMPGASSRDVVVGNDLVRSGPDGVKVLHSAPRHESLPSEQRLYNLAASQGFKGTFMDFLGNRVSTTEGARADLDLVSVPQSDGSARMMPRTDAVRMTSGGGSAPQPPRQVIPTQGNASITPDLMALIQSDAAKYGGGEPVINLNSQSPGAVFGIDAPMLGVSQSSAAAARDKEVATGKVQERETAKEAQRDSIRAQIGVIDKAIGHPGREAATGLSGVLDPRNYIPGTEAKNFQVVLEQLQGSAFLQAFESLKGGGQITEIEGKKATDAIARLNRAQSDEEFKVALGELREVMSLGLQRLGGATADGGRPTNIERPKVGDVVGGYRYKGGNPANRSNWVKQ